MSKKSAKGRMPQEIADALAHIDPGLLPEIIKELVTTGLIYDTGRTRSGQPVFKTTPAGRLLAEEPPTGGRH